MYVLYALKFVDEFTLSSLLSQCTVGKLYPVSNITYDLKRKIQLELSCCIVHLYSVT